MKLQKFLETYFGPYRFYKVSESTKDKLHKLCAANLCGSQVGLEIALVLINKRKASLISINLEKFCKRLGLYQIKIFGIFDFITKEKGLLPKIRKLKNRSWRTSRAEIGKILGYPSCCVGAFLKGRKLYFSTTKGFDAFLLHGKCLKDCQRSAALTKRYASLVKAVCPKMYLRLLGFWFCLEHLKEI